MNSAWNDSVQTKVAVKEAIMLSIGNARFGGGGGEIIPVPARLTRKGVRQGGAREVRESFLGGQLGKMGKLGN